MAKKEEKKEKLERTYNVPLRSGFVNTAKYKRAKKAVNILKEFIKKHMKTDEVKLGQNLNRELWKHGMKNPPHHVKITVTKEDDVAMAELVGFEYNEEKRPEKKVEEETTLKDRLTAKLGGKGIEEEKPKKGKGKKGKKKEERSPSEGATRGR